MYPAAKTHVLRIRSAERGDYCAARIGLVSSWPAIQGLASSLPEIDHRTCALSEPPRSKSVGCFAGSSGRSKQST
jgi:hypothetical protein